MVLVRAGKRLEDIGEKYEMSAVFRRAIDTCNRAINYVETRFKRESMARFALNGILKQRYKTMEQIRAFTVGHNMDLKTGYLDHERDLALLDYGIQEFEIYALMDLCRNGDIPGAEPIIGDNLLADLHAEVLEKDPVHEVLEEEEEEDGNDTDEKERKAGDYDNPAESVSGKEPDEPWPWEHIRKVMAKREADLKDEGRKRLAEMPARSLEATRETPASSQSVKMSPVSCGKELPSPRKRSSDTMDNMGTSWSPHMLWVASERIARHREGTERPDEKRPLKDGSPPQQPAKVLKVGSSSSNDREGSSTMSSAHSWTQTTSKT